MKKTVDDRTCDTNSARLVTTVLEMEHPNGTEAVETTLYADTYGYFLLRENLGDFGLVDDAGAPKRWEMAPCTNDEALQWSRDYAPSRVHENEFGEYALNPTDSWQVTTPAVDYDNTDREAEWIVSTLYQSPDGVFLVPREQGQFCTNHSERSS